MAPEAEFKEKLKFVKAHRDRLTKDDKDRMSDASKNYSYCITMGLCLGLCFFPVLKRIQVYNDLPVVGKSVSRLLLLFLPISIGSNYATQNFMVPTVEDIYKKYKDLPSFSQEPSF